MSRRAGRISLRSKGKLTSGADLLTSSGYTNDDGLSPAFVTRFQCGSHDTDVASTIERVVTASIRLLDQLLLDTLAAEFGRVDEVGRAELLRPRLLSVIDINGDDLASSVFHSALHDAQTDAAGSKDGYIASFLDSCSDHCGTISSRDTATEKTCTVHRSLWRDGHNGDVGDDRVL